MVKIICDICGDEAPGSTSGTVPNNWQSFNGVIVPPLTDVPTSGVPVSAHACQKHPNAVLRFVEESI